MAEIEADAAAQPELVFGLVGPLGTDLTLVASRLSDALAQVRYRSEVFRLSRLMREIPKEPWSILKDGPRDIEIEEHIKAGNELRRALDRQDAVAMLGVGAIREYRDMELGDPNRPLAGFAAIFHSLKDRKKSRPFGGSTVRHFSFLLPMLPGPGEFRIWRGESRNRATAIRLASFFRRLKV